MLLQTPCGPESEFIVQNLLPLPSNCWSHRHRPPPQASENLLSRLATEWGRRQDIGPSLTPPGTAEHFGTCLSEASQSQTMCSAHLSTAGCHELPLRRCLRRLSWELKHLSPACFVQFCCLNFSWETYFFTLQANKQKQTNIPPLVTTFLSASHPFSLSSLPQGLPPDTSQIQLSIVFPLSPCIDLLPTSQVKHEFQPTKSLEKGKFFL